MAFTGVTHGLSAGSYWSEAELAAAAAAYRRMLDLELSGVAYSKAEFRRDLLTGSLTARSNGSIEYRMQNISAVLDELGLPRINGYRPAINVGTDTKLRLVGVMKALWPEMGGSPLAVIAPPKKAAVRTIGVGAVHRGHYVVSAVAARTAEQREKQLVLRYKDWLEALGCDVVAHEYGGSLACDLFNETYNELIEAKSASTREMARMAVGQLLDYRRFEFSHPNIGVLFPARPSDSLLTYLDDVDVFAVWADGHDFVVFP